jgi:hypothetical protein
MKEWELLFHDLPVSPPEPALTISVAVYTNLACKLRVTSHAAGSYEETTAEKPEN